MDILSIYDYTGVMVEPWIKGGHNVLTVDLEDSEIAGMYEERHTHLVFDILQLNPIDIADFLNPDLVFAFPPCTHLAVTGAAWFKGKGLRKLSESIEHFAKSVEIAEYFECDYMIENPVSTISTYWREPDYKFHPCDFGDGYTKKTCLWTTKGFKMPSRQYHYDDNFDLFADKIDLPVAPSPSHHIQDIYLQQQGLNAKENRSRTPPGFARAVYEVNKP